MLNTIEKRTALGESVIGGQQMEKICTLEMSVYRPSKKESGHGHWIISVSSEEEVEVELSRQNLLATLRDSFPAAYVSVTTEIGYEESKR